MAKDVTLEAAAKSFIEYMDMIGRSQQSMDSYGKDLTYLKRFLEDRFNCQIYILDIKLDDIEAYLKYLKDERNYAPASVSRNYHSIRSFYNYLYKKEYVERNIALSLDPVKVPQKERQYLTEEEVIQLLEQIEHLLIKLVAKFLYFTGLRISECLDLRIEDVDLETGVVDIKNGKGAKQRFVPIAPRIRDELENYIEFERPNVETDFFFATKKTGRLSSQYVNRELKKAVKKLGWKKNVTCHILRHSFASRLIKKDVNLVQVQKLLGHSNLAVTSRYTHTNIEQLHEAVAQI